jgi:hypothetical protein
MSQKTELFVTTAVRTYPYRYSLTDAVGAEATVWICNQKRALPHPTVSSSQMVLLTTHVKAGASVNLQHDCLLSPSTSMHNHQSDTSADPVVFNFEIWS